MARKYTRDDVEMHSDGFGPCRPAVNVKVYGSLESAWAEYVKDEGTDEGFTLEWVRENVSDDHLDAIFWNTCENEFEYLASWATSDDDAIFPAAQYGRVTIEREGRSGGGAVVAGLPDIEEWDAVLLARWRKFERVAKEIAASVPLNMLSSLYINEWEWQRDETEERERAANQDVATLTA
jgi:hypothetical protein